MIYKLNFLYFFFQIKLLVYTEFQFHEYGMMINVTDAFITKKI